MPEIAITKNHEIENAVREAMEMLDLEDLIYNKIVAVKPNDTWASEKDKTAVTQPDTLRGTLHYVKSLGPKKIIVTGGSGAGETENIFKIAGLMDVVEEDGAEFFDHNKPPFEEIKLEYAPEKDVDGPQKTVMVNPRVLEYETLISLSQLKMHQSATVTLGLKNIAMSYPAADYYGHPRNKQKNPHRIFEDLHSFIAAMAKKFPINISVIAGHPAMIGAGPIGGYTFGTGLIIASRDPLACDLAGARLLGFNIQAVRHLWEAARLGVGEGNLANCDYPGMSMEDAMQEFYQSAFGKKL